MVAETPARAPLPQPGCQSHSSECLLGVGEGGLCPLPGHSVSHGLLMSSHTEQQISKSCLQGAQKPMVSLLRGGVLVTYSHFLAWS